MRLTPAFALGGLLTTGFVLFGILGILWTPYSVDAQSIANRLQSPSAQFWLGTDLFGRDLLSRVLAGATTALTVGTLGVGIGLLVGLPLGLLAAIRGAGLLDLMIARWVDLIFAFPALLTAALMAAVYGPGAINVIVALALFNIAVFARISRAATLSVLSRPFIQAALATGRSWPGIVARHLLPNIAGILIVQVTIQLAVAILVEAGLSYLGLGVKPPTPSWGKMLADAQSLLYAHPVQAMIPGSAIFLAVLGLNLAGDGLRDILDPKRSNLR